jgi:hypothetical protein
LPPQVKLWVTPATVNTYTIDVTSQPGTILRVYAATPGDAEQTLVEDFAVHADGSYSFGPLVGPVAGMSPVYYAITAYWNSDPSATESQPPQAVTLEPPSWSEAAEGEVFPYGILFEILESVRPENISDIATMTRLQRAISQRGLRITDRDWELAFKAWVHFQNDLERELEREAEERAEAAERWAEEAEPGKAAALKRATKHELMRIFGWLEGSRPRELTQKGLRVRAVNRALESEDFAPVRAAAIHEAYEDYQAQQKGRTT